MHKIKFEKITATFGDSVPMSILISLMELPNDVPAEVFDSILHLVKQAQDKPKLYKALEIIKRETRVNGKSFWEGFTAEQQGEIIRQWLGMLMLIFTELDLK